MEVTYPILDLKMEVGQLAHQLIPSINEQYNMDLKPEDFVNNEVYADSHGVKSIRLFSNVSKLPSWGFKTVVFEMGKQLNGYIPNPRVIEAKEVVENFNILINTPQELDFLSHLPLDVPDDSGSVWNNNAYYLAQLLNNYVIGGGWNNNSDGIRTTANFILRYFGSGLDAPEKYNFNRNTSLLVVIELLNKGVYKTYALALR